MKTVVQAGQTLLDIAVQEYGTIEAAFMLARTNDMGITDTLQAGQEIETPEKVYTVNWLITASGTPFVRLLLKPPQMRYD